MALERLEPCAGKLARTVLRRVVVGNGRHLSDQYSFYFTHTLKLILMFSPPLNKQVSQFFFLCLLDKSPIDSLK